MRIIVLGGGRQGFVLAKNLLARSEKPEVIIADIQEPAHLPNGVRFAHCDVLDPNQVATLVQDANAVALAVPSRIAHAALTNLLKTGVPVVDVSFTPDPPLTLNTLAKETGSVCIVDCGVAPGLCHLLVGAAYYEFGHLDTATIWVGGIPQHPPAIFKHAIYFNPQDLLAEYLRPARARKNGENIQPIPFDVPVEIFTDPELGKLEAFLSDGLRSLLTSFPDVKNMAELTLRWPGHFAAMKHLQQMKLFDSPESCYAIANAFAENYSAEHYPDFLLMVVTASYQGKHRTWRLFDKRTDNESAMSRTTAYTTAAMTMALARKQFTEAGVFPPEYLGRYSQLVSILIDDLRAHGILLAENSSLPVRC